MPPLCRPVASCPTRGHEPGQKYVLIAETARPADHLRKLATRRTGKKPVMITKG